MRFRLPVSAALSLALVSSGAAIAAASLFKGADPVVEASDALTVLVGVEARWRGEALRVRGDREASFDGLRLLGASLDGAVGRLATLARSESMPGALSHAMLRFLDLLRVSRSSLDRFVSDYAIVRNSIAFLPDVAAEVQRAADTAGAPAVVEAARAALAAADVHHADAGTVSRFALSQASGALEAALPAGAEPLRLVVDVMLSHLSQLETRHALAESRLREATAPAVSERAGALLAAFDERVSARKARLLLLHGTGGALGFAGLVIALWVGVQALRRRAGTGGGLAPAAVLGSTLDGLALCAVLGRGIVGRGSLTTVGRALSRLPIPALDRASPPWGALVRSVAERAGLTVLQGLDVHSSARDHAPRCPEPLSALAVWLFLSRAGAASAARVVSGPGGAVVCLIECTVPAVYVEPGVALTWPAPVASSDVHHAWSAAAQCALAAGGRVVVEAADDAQSLGRLELPGRALRAR